MNDDGEEEGDLNLISSPRGERPFIVPEKLVWVAIAMVAGIIALTGLTWIGKLACMVPVGLLVVIITKSGKFSWVDAVYETEEGLILEKNGIRERVRLDNITGVAYQRGWSDFRSDQFANLASLNREPASIVLALRAPCGFGDTIGFAAPGEVPLAFEQHSLVTHLKRKIGLV